MSDNKTIKIYIDSNIIIGYYLDEDGTKHKEIKNCFNKEWNKIEFLTSRWTLTEIIKVLIKNKNWSKDKTYKFIYKISNKQKLGNNFFKIIKVHPKSDYDFDDFFMDLDQELLEIKSSLGDSIHARIMRNYDIKYILTTNKSDFEQFSRFLVIEPSELRKFIENLESNEISEETIKKFEIPSDVGRIVEFATTGPIELKIERLSDSEKIEEPYFKVKLNKNKFIKGEPIITTADFLGELKHGFFDHYISDTNSNFYTWSWDSKTLPDALPSTPGLLKGRIKVHTQWVTYTNNLHPSIYEIFPRVYEHNIVTNERKIKMKAGVFHIEIINNK